MTYEDLSPAMRRYLGNWFGFRKLGYPADNLYCMAAPSAQSMGLVSAFLVLKENGREFSCDCGPCPEDFEAEYKRVAEAINAREMTEEELERMWEESAICNNKVGFLGALMAKGMWPRGAN